MRFRFFVKCEQFRLLHIGQHQILFMRNAQLTKAVAVGEFGHEVNLLGSGIAGRRTGFFQ